MLRPQIANIVRSLVVAHSWQRREAVEAKEAKGAVALLERRSLAQSEAQDAMVAAVRRGAPGAVVPPRLLQGEVAPAPRDLLRSLAGGEQPGSEEAVQSRPLALNVLQVLSGAVQGGTTTVPVASSPPEEMVAAAHELLSATGDGRWLTPVAAALQPQQLDRVITAVAGMPGPDLQALLRTLHAVPHCAVKPADVLIRLVRGARHPFRRGVDRPPRRCGRVFRLSSLVPPPLPIARPGGRRRGAARAAVGAGRLRERGGRGDAVGADQGVADAGGTDAAAAADDAHGNAGLQAAREAQGQRGGPVVGAGARAGVEGGEALGRRRPVLRGESSPSCPALRPRPLTPAGPQMLGQRAYNVLLQVPSAEVLQGALAIAPGVKEGLAAYVRDNPAVAANVLPELVDVLTT